MRRESNFMGPSDNEGVINEADFRHTLETIASGDLPPVVKVDGLEAAVRWGINGTRPDLAMAAYSEYVRNAWTWDESKNRADRDRAAAYRDEYFSARYTKEEETGVRHDGMPYFTLSAATELGRLESKGLIVHGPATIFRNKYVPLILEQFIELGDAQTPFDFLRSRRMIHAFRGIPRELEPGVVVEQHSNAALAALDEVTHFEGNRSDGFRELATFAVEYAQFPQFGMFDEVLRLLPANRAMEEHGIVTPETIFTQALKSTSRLQGNFFGAETILNGMRSFMNAKEAGLVDTDILTLRDWDPVVERFLELVSRNGNIPTGIALSVAKLESGENSNTASDAFQSFMMDGKGAVELPDFSSMTEEEALRYCIEDTSVSCY